jgi:hypothetical protein
METRDADALDSKNNGTSFGKERITSTAKSTHEGVGVTPAAHQTHASAGSGDSPCAVD